MEQDQREYKLQQTPDSYPISTTHPRQGAHTNVALGALGSNSFIELIGGGSVDPNLVHSDVAHFPEPSVMLQ